VPSVLKALLRRGLLSLFLESLPGVVALRLEGHLASHLTLVPHTGAKRLYGGLSTQLLPSITQHYHSQVIQIGTNHAQAGVAQSCKFALLQMIAVCSIAISWICMQVPYMHGGIECIFHALFSCSKFQIFCKFAALDARARFADVHVSATANHNLQICKSAVMEICKFAAQPANMFNAREQSICKSWISEGTERLQIWKLSIVQACRLASWRTCKLQ
jgi:hypothetical protein